MLSLKMVASHLHALQSQEQDSEEPMAMLEEITELFGYDSTRIFLDVSLFLSCVLKCIFSSSSSINMTCSLFYVCRR